MVKDLDAEIGVLAGIWQHGEDGLLEVSDIVNNHSFSDHTHQVFFDVFKTALGNTKRLDIPVLISTANQLKLGDIITNKIELIKRLEKSSILLNSVRIIGKRVARISLARHGQGLLREKLSELDNITGEESASQIISLIEKPGFDIQKYLAHSEESGQLIGKGCSDLVRKLILNPNREIGIATGLKEYDNAIGGGIRRKGFALIGARKKVGKSALAANIALYVAQRLKVPVLYLDTEMDSEQHQYRLLSNLTSIPIQSIEHSRFVGNKLFESQLLSASSRIETLPITHEVVSGKQFDEILSIARRWAVRTVGYHESGRLNNCLVVYDYFKLMDADNLKHMREHEALGYQAIQLSNFCVEMDLPALAFVQLNRELDIAQSDRLSWNATSVCTYLEKDIEEMMNDGVEYGNRKMIFDCARFGGGLDKENYININFNAELCQVQEVGTCFDMRNEKRVGRSGFDVDIDDQDLF